MKRTKVHALFMSLSPPTEFPIQLKHHNQLPQRTARTNNIITHIQKNKAQFSWDNSGIKQQIKLYKL